MFTNYFVKSASFTCLKFSLRKPYMIGFIQAELIADRWTTANQINIPSWSLDSFSCKQCQGW